jgi:hypothetical protein
MRGDIPPLPQYVFIVCLVKHRDDDDDDEVKLINHINSNNLSDYHHALKRMGEWRKSYTHS